MKPSRAQKLLKTFSIIEFIDGLFYLLVMILFLISIRNEKVMQMVKENHLNIYFGLFKLGINIILLFVSSNILRRTADDPSLHEKALTITLIVIAYEVISFVSNLGVGVPNDFVAMVISVMINLFIVRLVEKIREEYKQSVREAIRNGEVII